MKIKLNLKILLIFISSLFIGLVLFVSSTLVGYHSNILENYHTMPKDYKVIESKEEMFIALKRNGRIDLYKKGMLSQSSYLKSVLNDLSGHGLVKEDDEIVVKDDLLFLQKVFHMDITKKDLVDYTLYPYIKFGEELEFIVTVYDKETKFNDIKKDFEESVNREEFLFPFVLDFTLREYDDLFDLMKFYSQEFIVKNSTKENIVMTNISKNYLKNDYSLYSGEATSLKYISKDVIETTLRRKPHFDVVDFPISFSDGQTFFVSYCFKGDYEFLYMLSLIFAIMAFLTSFVLMTKPMSRYLKNIEKGIVKISQGNTDIKIRIIGNNELTSLASNVNMLTKALRDGFNKEKELDISRRILITHLSHDLLTPVTTIMGYLTLVSEKKWEKLEEMQEYVNGAMRKSEDLRSMIENILSYSLVLKNEPKAVLISTHWNELFKQYLDECNVVANNAGFKIITLNIDNYLGDILCSKMYLNRVVGNIILNSTRHGTSKEPISIKTNETKTHIELIVENYVNIKDCIKKTDHSCLERDKNNGLGLKICKQLMLMQDGYFETKFARIDDISGEYTFVVTIGIKKHRT